MLPTPFILQVLQELILAFMENVSFVKTKLITQPKVSTLILLVQRFVKDVTTLASSVLVMILTIALDVAIVVIKYMIIVLLRTVLETLLLVPVVFAVIKMIGGMIQAEIIIASLVIQIAEGAMGTTLMIASTVQIQLKE